MLGHRVGDAHDIRLLEGISADGLHAHLTGNHDHGHGVHIRVRDGRDHVRGTRAGSHDAHAHLASGQCVAFGGVAGGLLVAHKHEAELRVVFDLVVDGQNRAARNAEDVLDAEILQRTHQRLGAGHLLSIDDGLLVGCRVDFRHTAECLQRRG